MQDIIGYADNASKDVLKRSERQTFIVYNAITVGNRMSKLEEANILTDTLYWVCVAGG
ncbi:hypothetical protein KDAU_50210 [Dictyobacter aurantiacus]|uniref:Uncharacterized protein n=1 Tax=Dictyobacter aurantiacus TaxID=1936993 RepID=A0A401ZLI9_9CHLR|nr:hypothetical protein KDAU_50210 [Dictyobacter aurantiacus]